MDLLIEAAKAIDVAEKLRQKEEKHPPRPAPATAAAAAAVVEKTDDADVVDAAPFEAKPFLETAMIFGWTVQLGPHMQIRSRDVPKIEQYIRLIFANAFTAWVIFRRMQNDRVTKKKRSFEEFKAVLNTIGSFEPLFAGAPGKLSLILDFVDGAFHLMKARAAEEQKVDIPSVPAITTMQETLLNSGIDTTFETTDIDVMVDDIPCIGLFRSNFQPMAIYTGERGATGVLKRLAQDIARRKHMIANDGNDRPAKRLCAGVRA